MLAALNYPNIAQIHDLEKSPSAGSGQAGITALVMEADEFRTKIAMRFVRAVGEPVGALGSEKELLSGEGNNSLSLNDAAT